jgi:hypothetical protein
MRLCSRRCNSLYDKIHDIEERASGQRAEEQLTLKELADSLKNYVQAKREQDRAIPGSATLVPGPESVQ